jgi:hypothetical protein
MTTLPRPVAHSPKGEPLYSAKQVRMAFELGRRAMQDEIDKGKKE